MWRAPSSGGSAGGRGMIGIGSAVFSRRRAAGRPWWCWARGAGGGFMGRARADRGGSTDHKFDQLARSTNFIVTPARVPCRAPFYSIDSLPQLMQDLSHANPMYLPDRWGALGHAGRVGLASPRCWGLAGGAGSASVGWWRLGVVWEMLRRGARLEGLSRDPRRESTGRGATGEWTRVSRQGHRSRRPATMTAAPEAR